MQKGRAQFAFASLSSARSLLCGASTVNSACGRAASPGLTLIAAPSRMLMTSAALTGVQKIFVCEWVCVETWQGHHPPFRGYGSWLFGRSRSPRVGAERQWGAGRRAPRAALRLGVLGSLRERPRQGRGGLWRDSLWGCGNMSSRAWVIWQD